MYLHQLSTQWTSQCLHSGDYLFWDASQDQLTTRSIVPFERLWRKLLSWTHLVESTAQKCHQLCQITLGALIAQVPFKPFNFSASLIVKYPEVAKSCCEIWQQCALTWIQSSQSRSSTIPTDLKHIMIFEAHRRAMNPLLEALAQAEAKIQPALLPSQLQVSYIHTSSLQASSFTHYKHLLIDANNLTQLSSLLTEVSQAKIPTQTQSLQISTQAYTWPQPVQKQCQEMGIALWPRDLTKLEIDSIAYPEQLIQCLMMNPQIQRIHFKPSTFSGVVPANLAQAINELPHLQFTDLSNYLWPLPISHLPKCLVKVPKEHNSYKPLPQWQAPSWSQLNSSNYLGPRVRFFSSTSGEQLMSLPLGFVRRFTGFSQFNSQPPQLEVSLGEQEYQNLMWLFRIASRDISVTTSTLMNKAGLVDLLMTAYHWKMRSIIEIILSHLTDFRWSSECLDQLPTLPTHEVICPDLWIASSDSELVVPIDRYSLGLTYPNRAKSLQHYPDFSTVSLDKHPQITIKHIQQYYSSTPLTLSRENFEGFWALALSRKDVVILNQVLNFAKSIAFMKETSDSELSRWHALALGSKALSSQAHNLTYSIEWYQQKKRIAVPPVYENSQHGKFK